MDGNDDFHPEAERRASDPSLEDVLRRARDARLGGDPETRTGYPVHRGANFEPQRQRLRDVNLPSLTVFLAGLCVGVLLACFVVAAGLQVIRLALPGTSAQQTPASPTPVAIPTDTPIPTAMPAPTNTAGLSSPPPSTDEIVALTQSFYDNLSTFAGSYVLMDGPEVQIQSQDETQLTACLAYDYAPVSSPDTIAGSDTRTFTLTLGSDGTWQVMQMGDVDSCSMS